MGLAGRKIKQRIGADPRNLTWIDDSSKFGEKYLQSLGWSSGQGLGLTGDGRVDNIKIRQKLDLMGIGANRQGDDSNDWKAGREFDRLLSRLNQTQDTPTPQEFDTHVPSEFKKFSNDKDESTGGKRKRLSAEKEDAEERRRKKKKEKKELKEQKVKKKKAKETAQDVKRVGSPVIVTGEIVPDQTFTVKPTLYRAHRKRHLASKRLAAGSTQSMKEILGISSTVSDANISSTADATSTVDEAVKEGKDTGNLDINHLQKSEKSMADYFAEKLRLKKNGA